MAFGKLTITSESGEIEEYELTRATTSVGRQPGNDIVLPTSAVSRYHAQFDAADGQVFLVDLGTVNGSFVNDQQIESNGRIELKDGDVIQLGDVRMLFASPRRGTGPLSLHATEHVDDHVPITLILDDPQQPVPPGSFLQFAMVIENHSEEERVFTIEADGMDPDWIRINRREVRLADADQTEVLISVRPPRASDTRPGRYPLKIRVAYKDDPSKTVEVLREVDVMMYAGMAMAMKAARQPGQYNLAVQNQGNEALEIEMNGYQADQMLAFHFTPARFTVESGQTQQIILRVTPNKPIAPGQRVAFAAVAHSMDVAGYVAPLLGYYKPAKQGKSSGWLAGLVGLPLLGLIALVVVVLAAAGLVASGIVHIPGLAEEPGEGAAQVAVSATPNPPTSTPFPTAVPTPVVNLNSFSIEPSISVFGTVDKIEFVWEVDQPGNVKNYQLREDTSKELVPLSVSAPSVSRFEISVVGLVTKFGWGSHSFTLTITGVDGIERSSTASIKTDPVICTLQPAAQIYPAPGQTSGAPVAPPPSREVVLGGRTADNASVQVWDLGSHQPMGWVRTDGLTCPLTPGLNQFIEITPGPAATNTPAG